MTKVIAVFIAILVLSFGQTQAQNNTPVQNDYLQNALNRFDKIRSMRNMQKIPKANTIDYTVTNTSNSTSVENSLPWVMAQINSSSDPVFHINFNLSEDTIPNLPNMYLTSSTQQEIFINGRNINTNNNIVLSVTNPGVSQNRLFTILGAKLHFYPSHITLIGGNQYTGGAVFAYCIFDGYDITFKNSHAKNGGALYLSNSSAYLYRCNFINNTADNGRDLFSRNSTVVLNWCGDYQSNKLSSVKSTSKSIAITDNSWAVIDSSNISSISVGTDTTTSTKSSYRSPRDSNSYNSAVSFAETTVGEIFISDKINSGQKYLTHFTKPTPMEEDSVKAFSVINDSIFTVDSANVDLVMDSVNVTSSKWEVKQGQISVINMPDSGKANFIANITMQDLILTGGKFINTETPLNVTNINAQKILMTELNNGKTLLPSQLSLGTGVNVTKTTSDGIAFVQVGDGCAVNLSGDANVAVPVGETLFDLADDASLIIESDQVTTTGAFNIGVSYDNATAFISSPVPNFTIPVTVATFQTWNEGTSAWDNITTGTFGQMVGYKAVFSGTQTINFVGNLPAYSQNITLVNTDISNANDNGWNLVGNPYTSALDFEAITLTGIDKAVYTLKDADKNYGIYMQGGLSVNDGSQLINKGEAFYLRANANNANFAIVNQSKVHAIPSLLVLEETNAKSYNGDLRITLSDGTNTDQVVFADNDNASIDYVEGEDAVKLFTETLPQLFSVDNNNVNIAINVFNIVVDAADITIPLHVTNASSGSFTLTLENNFSKAEHLVLYLHDLVTDDMIDFTANPSYTFTADGTEARFEIVFHSVTADIDNNIDNVTLNVYPNPTTNVINVNSQIAVSGYQISNVLGQEIISGNLSNNKNFKIDVNNLEKGTYLLTLYSNENVLTTKLIVKK